MYTEKFRSFVLAHIHGYLFKIFMIKEVVGPDHFPVSEKVEKLLEMYQDLWPYSFPEFLKNDFVSKMQSIFKKKFVGDD